MIITKTPFQVLGYIIVMAVLLYMGPSLADFSSDSIIEFTAFYVNLSVLFCAGLFLKGPVNRRIILVFATSLVFNHLTYYLVLDAFSTNIYARFWTMFIATLPLYFMMTYYTYIQCKALSFFQRCGVSDAKADKIVGPIGTTNLSILISFYVTFWLVVDFSIAVYSTILGLFYGLEPTGSLVQLFNQHNIMNHFFGYDTLILLVDALVTILFAFRIFQDQKKPDALGTGKYMTWDGSCQR